MQRSALAAAVVASLVAPAVPLAYGEPVNGFPSWEERVLFEWTNRARSDPQAEMATCGARCAEAACYAPRPPLLWDDASARAARFHADEMRLQGYFGHDSACTLPSDIASRYPATCDGSASCACAGTVATTWHARVKLFVGGLPLFDPAVGENVGSGASDPDAAFQLWLYESSSSTACSPGSANSDRWAILQDDGFVGTGLSGTLGVMDFTTSQVMGVFGGRIPSGAHYPRQGPSVEAWANWYVPGYDDPPAAAAAVVDGSCAPMTLERGSQRNGAWRAVLNGLDATCHRYYFAFRNAAGTLYTYPTTGSFGIGDAACADFSTSRPPLPAGCVAAACDPSPGGCDDGNPCTVDACEATGCTHAAVANGTACSDANVCNGAETCQSGACAAGTPLSCDDANPCTADACNPVNGCTSVPVANGTSCSDANACDGAETCQAGACVLGTPLACDDGNPCTADACDAQIGCVHPAVLDGAACSDGDACTTGDTCQSGLCTSGAAISCDDGNLCTVDACDAAAGCTHAAAPAATACSDGQDCNGPEHCDGAGACAPGTTCQGATPPDPSPSGCGCGAGSGGSALVLALTALAVWRPRPRRRRG